MKDKWMTKQVLKLTIKDTNYDKVYVKEDPSSDNLIAVVSFKSMNDAKHFVKLCEISKISDLKDNFLRASLLDQKAKIKMEDDEYIKDFIKK